MTVIWFDVTMKSIILEVSYPTLSARNLENWHISCNKEEAKLIHDIWKTYSEINLCLRMEMVRIWPCDVKEHILTVQDFSSVCCFFNSSFKSPFCYVLFLALSSNCSETVGQCFNFSPAALCVVQHKLSCKVSCKLCECLPLFESLCHYVLYIAALDNTTWERT